MSGPTTQELHAIWTRRAVDTFRGGELSMAGPGSAICSQMPLFASREAGERWQVGHPGVGIVDLDEAREIARAYVQGCCR
jgi:Alkylmercury lyase